MDERDVDMERFDQLIERSSLGTPGARRLRKRTPPAQVAAARRIAHLRNRIVHSRGDHDVAAAVAELADLLVELGYHGQADHVLHEWLPCDGGVVADIAAARLHSVPQADTRQSYAETTAEPKGASTLTLMPVSGRFASDDPRWYAQVHELFIELNQQIKEMSVTFRRADDLLPEAAEPLVLVLVIHNAAGMNHLVRCARHWVDRDPGRSLNIVASCPRWSQQIVLRSGGIASPIVPAPGASSPEGEHTYGTP